MRPLSRGFCVSLLVLLLVAAPSGAGESAPSSALEYEVKAAFLYHFAQFTEWPSSALDPSGTTLVIGIVGEDPFGQALDGAIAGKTVQNRSVQILHFARPEEIRPCQILFIGAGERKRWSAVLERLRGKPVLTVGETTAFTEQGGLVDFFVEDARVRFEINLPEADRAGLKFSSKLLKVARLVPRPGGGRRG